MIEVIVRKKKPVYFISPHVDDAFLSAGSLIFDLSKKICVHIVTVFGGSTYTDKNFSKTQCTAMQSVLNRKKIEKKLIKGRNIKLHYLTFPEWAIREDSLLFERAILKGNNRIKDRILQDEVKEKLKMIIRGPATVFCPLGIGGHRDHVIVRNTCVDIVSQKDLCFWSDYPYSLIFRQYHDSFVSPRFYRTSQKYTYSTNLVQKGLIVHAFQKYLEGFFKDKKTPRPIFPEIYYAR